MDANKYTIKAQEALQKAIDTATAHGQQMIEAEHLLWGTLSVGEKTTSYIFNKLGVNEERLLTVLKKQLESLPKVSAGDNR